MILKKRTLMFKLMTAINLSALIALIAMTAFILKKTTDKVESQIDDEVSMLINSIKHTTAEYVKTTNVSNLQTISDQIVKDEVINEIYFYSKENKLIASAKNKEVEVSTKKLYELKSDVIKLGEENLGPVGRVIIKYNHTEIEQIRNDFILIGVISIIISQILLTAVMWFALSRSIKSLNLTTEKLHLVSKATKVSSNEIENISHEVSSSANQQAASIQETVATLDQITSQVNTTVESVESSTKKSQESLQIATEGKNVVTEMIHSMEDIGKSNKEIMEEIARGNERIGGIVKIINEISQKTAVINDIVFQTKLLSFNASVEAARAGEHGKGFAVVAEEVGNLAQMSGKASKEIADILNDSIVKVNAVIEETNSNVKTLTDSGSQKVESGMKVAEKCGVVLDEIVTNADVVKNMLNEISVASKEQAEGVRNIAAAMNQLDQATLNNNKAATQSSENARQLSNHSASLESAIEELQVEIFGGKIEVQSQLTAPNKISPIVLLEKSAQKHVEMKKAPEKEVAKKIAKENVKEATKEVKRPVAKKDNILPMVKKTPPETSKPKQITKAVTNEVPRKKMAANDVPTYDDPRFEDV